MGNQVPCEQCGQAYEPSKLLRGQCPACLFAQALPEGDRRTDAHPARFIPPKISELAPLFPQLEILELTGCGGMSAVYKASQTHLGRTIAIKVLPQEIAASQGGLERFEREAKTLAQLNHPNIVQVYDAGQAGPWCYILMEFVAGPNLRQLLGESQLPSSEVLKIASAICDGLQYAHDLGIVHRDIKPENVLLDSDGQVKLVDFGLAKLLNSQAGDAATSRTGQVLGTPHYLAPEQIETPASVDHRADVYSLGVLMYEMLTGELPLGHFQPPSRRIGSDPALDAVILQAMAKDRQQRYQRARDLKAHMASAAAGTPVQTTKAHFDWSRLAQELLLSCCSVFAAVVGIVALGNGIDGYRLADHVATPILPSPVLVGGGLIACLLSLVFARINISSKSSWQDISWPQYPSLSVLVAAYALFGLALLIGPGIAVMLLGGLPLFAKLEYWSVFGQVFADADRTSLLTPYWLRVYGISLLTSAAWCIPIGIVLRKYPSLVQGLFHPTTEKASADITQAATLFAITICIPLGLVLLLASWLATKPF